MKLADVTLCTTLAALIREGRKILQADPGARVEDCVTDTTAEKLASMTSTQLIKLLKKVRKVAVAHYGSRKAKDWLQRSADALRAHP